MQLFKYCRHSHLLSATEAGSLRLGTLHDYRTTGKYGELIADPEDGIKSMGGTIRNLTEDSIHLYPAIAGLIGVEGGGGFGRIEIGNAKIISPNFLVFSASSIYSDVMHRKWLAEEGYDACYTITSSRLFFRAISAALGQDYTFIGAHSVIYADKLDIATRKAGSHPAFFKRQTEYADQSEFRAIWSKASNGEIKPIILSSSNAKLYAQPYRVLSAA
jgi:hypothetical protein